MGIFDKLFPRKPQATWSPKAAGMLELGTSSLGLLTSTGRAAAALGGQVDPFPFQIYADFGYGAMTALMRLCLNNLQGDEAELLARVFRQVYENDLRALDSVQGEFQMQVVFREPSLENAVLNPVQALGHQAMFAVATGKADSSFASMLLTLLAYCGNLTALNQLIREYTAKCELALQA